MTIPEQEDIAERLRDHVGDDHKRGCAGRQYLCTCKYDETTEHLLQEAAAEIKRLNRLILGVQATREDVARAIKSNVYAHPDPDDKALAFVDDESIDDAARAVLALPHTGQAQEEIPLQECEGFRSALEDVANPLNALRPVYQIQAIARRALSVAPSSPPQAGCAREGWPAEYDEYIPDIVKNAMLTAWNEICSDTEHHPTDIERNFEGRKGHLGFTPAHWADLTGKFVAETLKRAASHPPPVAESGWQEIVAFINAEMQKSMVEVGKGQATNDPVKSNWHGGRWNGFATLKDKFFSAEPARVADQRPEAK